MKLTSISLAAALALTTAGASFAQPASAPPGAPGARAEGRHWQRPDPAQMAERHAQRLRDTLQLRPDQEPALRAFIAATAPRPGDHDRMRKGREAGQTLTTPARLDRMEARMAEHQARFHAHAEALRRFYAQLSPSQQKAFDAMPRHEGMGRGGMGHGQGHGGGAWGGHGGMRHGGPGGPDGPDRAPPPAGD